MRLWPLSILRRMRRAADGSRILPLDPREQRLLDRQRAARETSNELTTKGLK